MPDDAPPWPNTIVATWPAPDPQPILLGSVVAGVLGWTTHVSCDESRPRTSS